MHLARLTLCAALVVVNVACDQSANSDSSKTPEQTITGKTTPATIDNQAKLPAGHPNVNQTNMPGVKATSQVVNQGMVKQSFIGGGYSYAQVDAGGQLIWLAGPAAKLEIGSNVGWKDAALMQDFNSPSLNRSFSEIYFVSSFVQQNKGKQTSGVVEEVIPTAGYVYLKVKSGNSSVWLAASETQIKSGESVSWQGGAVMRNFRSNSLDKVFPEVILVDKIVKI